MKFRFWDWCFKLKSWFIAAGTFAFNRQIHLRSHWFMELPRRVQWAACENVFPDNKTTNWPASGFLGQFFDDESSAFDFDFGNVYNLYESYSDTPTTISSIETDLLVPKVSPIGKSRLQQKSFSLSYVVTKPKTEVVVEEVMSSGERMTSTARHLIVALRDQKIPQNSGNRLKLPQPIFKRKIQYDDGRRKRRATEDATEKLPIKETVNCKWCSNTGKCIKVANADRYGGSVVS